MINHYSIVQLDVCLTFEALFFLPVSMIKTVRIPQSPYVETVNSNQVWQPPRTTGVLDSRGRDDCAALRGFISKVESSIERNPLLWDAVRM